MFRAEEKLELESGNGFLCVLGQDVDGSAAMGVETCLIGQQPHTQRTTVLGSKSGKFREVVILEHIDAGCDLSVAVMPKAFAGDGFVVAGQLGSQTSAIWPELRPTRPPRLRPLRGWR